MTKKLRAAVIGVGNIGRQAHLPGYASCPNTEIVAICDTHAGRLAQAAQQYGVDAAHTYADYREMYEKENLDVVSVCTPTYAHYDQTVDALNKGIHVHCEKPMAMNTEETVKMVQAAKAAGKLLAVGYNNRFRLDATTLRKYYENGVFGDIYYAKSGWLRRRGNPHGWFTQKSVSGGGPLIDCGVHALDLTHWLMGQPQPVSVTASTYCKFGNYNVEGIGQYWAESGNEEGIFDTEDLATAFIKFANGATMMYDVSWAYNGENTGIYTQLHGDKAGANLDPVKIYGEVEKNIVDYEPHLNLKVNAQEKKVHNFTAAVLGQEELLCPGHESIVIAQIVDAIYESAASGATVTIPAITLD